MLCWSLSKLQSLQSGKGRTLKVWILHGFFIYRDKELNKTLWNLVVNKEINYKLLQLSSKALRFRWLILNMYGPGIMFFTRGTEHLGDHKASSAVGIFLQKHLTSLAFSRSLVYWDFWPFINHFKSAFKIHAGTALTAYLCSVFISMGPFI